MAKYIDPVDFFAEYLLSKGYGYMTDGFKNTLYHLVDITLHKHRPSPDIPIYAWFVKKRLNLFWMNYNPDKNSNPLPYYGEVIKRFLAMATKKPINDLRKEYYWEVTVKERKPKLIKIMQKCK